MKKENTFIGIAIAACVAFLFLILTLVNSGVRPPSLKELSPSAKPCTEEAKLCPDGSAVAREGENCEFPDCPESEVVSKVEPML